MCYHRPMAYNRPPAEHAFIKIERDLKAGDVPRLILLCGREDYLTDHYAHVLIDRFVEPASRQLDLVTLSGTEVTSQAIEENAASKGTSVTCKVYRGSIRGSLGECSEGRSHTRRIYP